MTSSSLQCVTLYLYYITLYHPSSFCPPAPPVCPPIGAVSSLCPVSSPRVSIWMMVSCFLLRSLPLLHQSRSELQTVERRCRCPAAAALVAGDKGRKAGVFQLHHPFQLTPRSSHIAQTTGCTENHPYYQPSSSSSTSLAPRPRPLRCDRHVSQPICEGIETRHCLKHL